MEYGQETLTAIHMTLKDAPSQYRMDGIAVNAHESL